MPGNDECARCQLDLAPLDQPRPHDRVQKSLLEDPVQTLGPRPPVTVVRETPLRDAVRTMLDAGVGTVLVVDEAQRLAGIFSERDLLVRVGALAPDGIIEAIESTDANWFCIGVQWHPEADTATALDLQLFECFIQACLRQEAVLQAA